MNEDIKITISAVLALVTPLLIVILLSTFVVWCIHDIKEQTFVEFVLGGLNNTKESVLYIFSRII
jgi:hypothetical protein